METDLLPRVVHELVICTAEYFPETRECGMWDDKVACCVTICISYFGVVNADPVSGRGLGANMSKPLRRWSLAVERGMAFVPQPPTRRPHDRQE